MSGGEEPGWTGAARIMFIVVTLILVAVYVGRNGWPW